MKIATVVGNPKPRSRTFEAAAAIAQAIDPDGPAVEVDLIEIADRLLGWNDPVVSQRLGDVMGCDVVIFASPTYKGTYTGLLKLFLDQIDTGGLNGMPCVALMVGAAPHHSLAPELTLRPVLVKHLN